MSRSWQYIGFTATASEILNETVKVGTQVTITYDLEDKEIGRYTTDRLEPAYTKVAYEKYDIWYGEMNVLHRYTFPDGRILEDYVQSEPWSSGPCTFMALRDATTKEPLQETLWPDEAIQNA